MQNLRIPGPTPCPPEVLAAMGRQMINHRGVEFAEIVKDVTVKMKQVFQTKNDLMLLTGSGTAGLEAAVVNMLSPGDTVLGVSIGVFGERFAKIAQTFGAIVIPLNFEHGKAADPALIQKALDANPQIKAVLVTHNETSTGVTNDLAAISRSSRALASSFWSTASALSVRLTSRSTNGASTSPSPAPRRAGWYRRAWP